MKRVGCGPAGDEEEEGQRVQVRQRPFVSRTKEVISIHDTIWNAEYSALPQKMQSKTKQ